MVPMQWGVTHTASLLLSDVLPIAPCHDEACPPTLLKLACCLYGYTMQQPGHRCLVSRIEQYPEPDCRAALTSPNQPSHFLIASSSSPSGL